MNTISLLDSQSLPVLEKRSYKYYGVGLSGVAISLALYQYSQSESCILYWVQNTDKAREIADELSLLMVGNREVDVWVLPEWETLPYDTYAIHPSIVSERMETLYHLVRQDKGIYLLPISAGLFRLPEPSYIMRYSFILEVNQVIEREHLMKQLVDHGYAATNNVYHQGEFSVRGSLLDIFPMGVETPYRIDFFDNEVVGIRSFDSQSQRSQDKVEKINILPASDYDCRLRSDKNYLAERWTKFWGNRFKTSDLYREIYSQNHSSQNHTSEGPYYLPLFAATATLFDYISPEVLQSYDRSIVESIHSLSQLIGERYQKRSDEIGCVLKPLDIAMSEEEFWANMKKYRCFVVDKDAHSGQRLSYDFRTEPLAHNSDEDPLLEVVSGDFSAILFVVPNRQRLQILQNRLYDCGEQVEQYSCVWDFLQRPKPLAVVVGYAYGSFLLKDLGIAVVTEAFLYPGYVARKERRRKSRKRPLAIVAEDHQVQSLAEIAVDDLLVHQDYGVGRYGGLQVLAVEGIDLEFLVLCFKGTDKIYVPVDQLNKVSRFIGNKEMAKIDALRGDQWTKAKKKVVDSLEDIAVILLQNQAKRAEAEREPYAVTDHYYQFVANFLYEETRDQERAIDAVITDLTSSKSMDRLVCGDVGFGKTEVAMRAIFIVAFSKRQVALLVPTTLLAQQHYESLVNRFAGFSLSIALFAGTMTAKESTKIGQQLSAGTVDIVVGTHKLLQKSVKFHSLGLVVVDEEHRFGVKQKERLTSLRGDLDILSLTATPIPRTLNHALIGVRDLSIIATPPDNRLMIDTFVGAHSDAIVEEAISRELFRGGQVYYLHNRIASIEKKCELLRKQFPHYSIGLAHGQMAVGDLEQVMKEFAGKQHAILVCTSIIENGLDIPNANTVIVERADLFGLPQLHQIRGRVGRSSRQAYAYFLTPSQSTITGDAHKRLQAIQDLKELGSGYLIANQDMEIRGIGDLLGTRQSGNAQRIGVTLYLDLLKKAIQALKKGEQCHLQELEHGGGVTVQLGIPALIPESYIQDIDTRLYYYQLLGRAVIEQLSDIECEFIDRFGAMPPYLENLFEIRRLVVRCELVGVQNLSYSKGSLRFELGAHHQIVLECFLVWVQRNSDTITLIPEGFVVKVVKDQSPLVLAQYILGQLESGFQ